MSKSTGYILSIILVIGIGAILQYFLCCGTVGSIAGDNSKTSSPDEIAMTGMPFSLKGPDGNFSFNSDHNFDFPVSSYSYIKPIDASLEDGIGQLRTYLEKNQDINLGIKGYGYKNEENTSAFPSLGEARANAVKSALIDRGISGSQVTVSGEAFSGVFPSSSSVVNGPVGYKLIQSEMATSIDGGADGEAGNDAEDDFSAFVSDLQLNPMVLHFETGSAYVNLTADERQRISRLNQYIDQNSEARIQITGHTDNSGNPETNQRLGKERAEFLKSYLIRNGFQANRITTISRGESEPVATNDSETGKAENRRVILTIDN